VTKDEMLQKYSIADIVQMATISGIIKLVREVGKDFSETAIRAVLEKMYPQLMTLDLDAVIEIGDKVRETLGVSPMTHTKADIHEVREALAAVHGRKSLPLSRRIHRMMNPETHDGWISLGGVKYAVTPSFNADFDGETPYNLVKPTEAK
jgi:hypothetical protein